MIPFVRTVQQAKDVLAVMAENGLERGKDDLKVIMMSELPTNALLADQYLEHFDGMSIGSNDMTQLAWGWIGIQPWSQTHSTNETMP